MSKHFHIRYFWLSAFVVFLLSSCKSEHPLHSLRTNEYSEWFEPVPYGMSYIKAGFFQTGMSDEQVEQPFTTNKTVSVNSFWMDDTEITNNEYRQFINWVLDSVAAHLTFKAGFDDYRKTDRSGQFINPPMVDRLKVSEIWSDERSEIKETLQPLYYQDKERLFNKKEIDFRNILYRYAYVDLKKAAKRSNSYNYENQQYESEISRADFILEKAAPVYPDTLVWIRDFTYSFNEPWTLKYFHHPAFREYPVVGVNWEQANAFSHWRTKMKRNFLKSQKIKPIHPYRLPTEIEWEYAARGGRMNAKYPWGGYYTSSQEGCYLANFKPKRGNYVADSRYSTKSMKVGSFDPNDFGLYDMAGNVAEWTSTAYDVQHYQMMHDMNPEYQYDAQPDDPPAMKRKVVRGGSWKDVSYYIQVSTRDFEYQDSATSFIGFRCVMNAIEDERKSYE